MENNSRVLRFGTGLILLPVLAVQALFVFFNLSNPGFEHPEVFSVMASSADGLGKMFRDFLLPDVHPPLYQTVLFVWIRIAGNSEAGARALSAVFGLCATMLTYWLAKRVFSKSTSLTAAVLIALSPFALEYERMARSYGMLLCLSAVSTLLWLRLVQGFGESSRKGSIREWAAFTLVAAATLLTHYFGVVLVGSLLGYLFALAVLRREQRVPVLVCGIVAAGLFLPWNVTHVLFQRAHGIESMNPAFFKPASLEFFFRFFHYVFPFLNGSHFSGGLFFGFLLFGIERLARALFADVRSLRLSSPWFALAYLSVAPLSALAVYSLRHPMLFERNLIIFLPAFLLFLAQALSRHPHAGTYRLPALMFAVSLSILVSFFWKSGVVEHDLGEQYRESAQFVMDRYDGNSMIVETSTLPGLDYYFRRFQHENSGPLVFRNVKDFGPYADPDKAFSSALEVAASAGKRKLFLYMSHGSIKDISPAFRKVAAGRGAQISRTEFGLTKVFEIQLP